jgi:pre-mRNA-splicing factor CDC5/CEF1
MASRSAWTNVEDEVLKAAVSKYGLNNWARVSSLLARKSAKQCKERYESWIDPRISKQEWTREEDERLLHYARVFPSAWRTVAQLMSSRTASQCIQRYQQLLDEEEKKQSGEFALTGVEGESSAPTADDVRKLRPGEVDVDIASRPARPDAVDMDEDELEMLSEARARLANTQGKKSKRKARERQLETSRRIALLQKRRELKMSGINIKLKFNKKGEMDYNADIPFERQPAEGFFDTMEEIERNAKEKEDFDPRKQQIALKRKNQDDEQDDRKNKKRATDSKPSISMPPPSVFRAARPTLNLPEPSVNDQAVDMVVKSIKAQQGAFDDDSGQTPMVATSRPSERTGATPFKTPAQRVQALSQTPARTPLETTREKQNLLAKLQSLPKPKVEEYEIDIGEENRVEKAVEEAKLVEDASIRDAREKALREAAEKAEFLRQSQVVQRRLPKPVVVDITAMLKNASDIEDRIRSQIATETAHLIANDALKFGGSKVNGTAQPIPASSDTALNRAKLLVAKELASEELVNDKERFTNAWLELHGSSRLPGLEGYYEDEIDEHQMLVETFELAQDRLVSKANKSHELEKKLAKLHGGYLARAKILRQKVDEAAEALEKTRIHINTTLSAQVGEDAAIESRLERLREEVAFVSRREREAQEAYRLTRDELGDLEMVNGH